MKGLRPAPEDLQKQGLAGVRDNVPEGHFVCCHEILFQFLEPQLRELYLEEQECLNSESSS